MKRNFCFFHPYHPETWQAMIDCGLVKDGDGVKFSQNLLLKDEYKFNNLAAKGTELYRYLEEKRAPFYIDRLQGGCYIEEYPYDMALVDEYREMLGDRFMGWQMHEWLSNYKSDLRKMSGFDGDWRSAEEIKEYIFEQYPYPCLFLESMSAKEMAERGNPANVAQFRHNMLDIYKKKKAHAWRTHSL